VGGVPVVEQVCADGFSPTGPVGSEGPPDPVLPGPPTTPVQPVEIVIAIKKRNFIVDQANKSDELAASKCVNLANISNPRRKCANSELSTIAAV
jgi:hypothetical protein